jgi:hypothetical protein
VLSAIVAEPARSSVLCWLARSDGRCQPNVSPKNVLESDADFADFARPLEEMTKGRFPIRGVFVVEAHAVEPIIAPSYLFYPAETNEDSQIASAMQSYGVRTKNGDD